MARRIGLHARPDAIHKMSALPKTTNGKILRRFLNKVCNGDFNFGDTSIMDNFTVLEELLLLKHQN